TCRNPTHDVISPSALCHQYAATSARCPESSCSMIRQTKPFSGKAQPARSPTFADMGSSCELGQKANKRTAISTPKVETDMQLLRSAWKAMPATTADRRVTRWAKSSGRASSVKQRELCDAAIPERSGKPTGIIAPGQAWERE